MAAPSLPRRSSCSGAPDAPPHRYFMIQLEHDSQASTCFSPVSSKSWLRYPCFEAYRSLKPRPDLHAQRTRIHFTPQYWLCVIWDCISSSSSSIPPAHHPRRGLIGRFTSRALRVQLVAWCRPRGLRFAPLSSCTESRLSPLVDTLSQSVISMAVPLHHLQHHQRHRHSRYSREPYHQSREKEVHR